MIQVINYAHQYPQYHLEMVYQQCVAIIQDAVQTKHMGWMYRTLLLKSLQNSNFYIATDNIETARILGFALCRDLKRTGMISLDKLGVDRAWRHRGIGTQLLNHIKAVGKPIRIEVVKHNVLAKTLYTKNGFVESQTKTIGNGINLIVMYFTPSCSQLST